MSNIKIDNAAAAMAKHRWANATEADRQKAADIGRMYGGRPKLQPRCPCGEMTVARAEQRNHKCEPKPRRGRPPKAKKEAVS